MIFRSSTRIDINSWTNIFSGEAAFILGNGPSLLDNNLKLLSNYFTIGINRAYKAFLPTILMWQDESLYSDCYEDIRKIACIKITRKEIDFENVFSHFHLERGGYKFSNNPAKLYGCGSTAVLAVQMAVAMGCSSIVLLGCDCSYRNGMTDFYGINKFHLSNTLDNFNAAMMWVFKNSPVPIYNCGPAPFWPQKKIETVINEIGSTKRHRLNWISRLMSF